MSCRPLNAPVSIAACAMAFVLAGCGSQATDPVRFNKVIVTSGDGTTIQLSADMCQGQPYTTVVKESADVVSIQLLGTRPDGNPALRVAIWPRTEQLDAHHVGGFLDDGRVGLPLAHVSRQLDGGAVAGR